jgi:hypothetical protein
MKPIEFIFLKETTNWRCDAYSQGQIIGIGRGRDRVAAAQAARVEARHTRAVATALRSDFE